MAAEVSSDLNFIHDEDVLRRMWQQTEDFSRKKEIRSRMYKLREQRLKDFYTTGEVLSDTMSSRKYTGTTHTDSIGDQGFLTMKTKEIRDSESPTREIRRREDDNNYWNTVQQQTSYYTSADGDGISQTYEKTFADRGVSDDGNVQTQIAANEKGFHSSTLHEDEHSKTQSDQSSRTTQVVSSLEGKSDNGDYQYSTSSNKEDSKTSSFKTSQVSDTSQSSQRIQSSSSSSSSTRRVVSSSSYKYEGNNDDRLLSRDIKSITADDSDRILNVSDDSRKLIQQESGSDDVYNSSKTHHVTSAKNVSSTYDTKNIHSTEIDINVNSNVPSKQNDVIYYDKDNTDSDLRTSSRYEDTYTYRTSSPATKVDKTIYKTELTSDVQDYSAQDKQHIANITRESKQPETDKTNVVVDQKIMTELQNLDTFLSTQNTTGTSTPVSPRSVTGDAANWTVVSNTDGEFVYSIDKKQKADDTESVHTFVTKVRGTGQPSSLDIPKEHTSGQYVTTYQQSYTNKRISVDNSPTHEAFARSLRQSPPSTPRSTTPRSLSKGSLDRSSPERKFKSSPFTSPDKERRGSVGSHTVEKTKDTRRKTSETIKHGTSDVKDVTVKTKRKLSSTQSKATSKTRASTPGTSPILSPTRKQRDRSSSPSSENDSDASQHTYDKTSASSTLKRAEITKRKLVDSFNDVNIQKSLQSTEDITVSTPKKSSPEKTISDGHIETVRKDSKTDSRKTFTTSLTTDTKRGQHVSDTQSTEFSKKSVSTDQYPEEIDIVSNETVDVRETNNLYHPSTEPSLTQYTSENVILAEREHAELTQKTTDVSETQELINRRFTTTKDSSVVQNETDYVVKEKSSPTKKEPSPSRKPSSPEKDYSSPKSSPKNIPHDMPRKHENEVICKETLSNTDDFNRQTLKQTAVIETNLIFTQQSPSSPKETIRKTSYTVPKEKAPSPTKETFIKKTTAYVSPKDRSPSPPKSPVARASTPQKSPQGRSPSPSKSPVARSPTSHKSPNERSPSPPKSPLIKSSIPQKSLKERSPSPQKEDTVRKTTVHLIPKDRSPSPQKVSKERSPSPQQSPNKRTASPPKDSKEKSPSPQRSPTDKTISPQSYTKERSPSPHKIPKERTPSPQKFPKEKSPSPHKTDKEVTQILLKKERSPSPDKSPKERSPSPNKFPKDRSPSPEKISKERPQSPDKLRNERSPSPPKQTSYRSPKETSPIVGRETIVKTTSVYVRPGERAVSPHKDVVIKKSTTYERDDSIKKIDLTSKKEIRQPTKPTKDDTVTSRLMSPNKHPIYKRPAAPEKTKSSAKPTLSPQKPVIKKITSTEKEIVRTTTIASPAEDKIPVYDRRSPSISPCSSPERNADVRRVTTETTIKLSTTEKPSGVGQPQTFTRPTRQSSIPRSEKTSAVRKVIEKKTDIRVKETERRSKPIKEAPSFKKPTDSPVSRGSHTVVTTTFRTTIRKPVDSPKREPSKPTKPTNVYQSPSKKPVTSPVTKLSVTPKKVSPKVKESTLVKSKKTTTVVDTRNTHIKPKPKESVKPTPAFDTLSQDEDRSSAVSSPETVRPVQPRNSYPTDFDDTDVYEDVLQKDTTDSTVHMSGVSDHITLQNNVTNYTVDVDIYEENIEDEKPPEYFPDEDDNIPEDSKPEISVVDIRKVEKTTSIKSKTHKSTQDTHKTSQDTLTIRKTVNQTPKTTPSPRKSGPPKTYTSPVKKLATPQLKKPLTIQPKQDSIKSTLEKNTTQRQIAKNQTSKQEFETAKLTTDTETRQKKAVSKVTHTKRIAETGIATRNVSAAQKRTTITKKKGAKIKSHVEPSSSSEDEEEVTDIPTDNVDEQTYIQELEDLRREEENTYASKVMSTSDQEIGLLSVIVQHPTSSRESSPEYALLEQPSCTVSDDGSSHPRYADVVSEPEDVDTYYTQDVRDNTSQRNTSEAFISKERHYEKITDLDDDVVDNENPNVSVADRVSQFLEQTKTDKSTVRQEDVTRSTESGTKSVLKAKTMFENIAKKQVCPPAPSNKPVDILSRPSIFEARRGQTVPKQVTSDTVIISEEDEIKYIPHDEVSPNNIVDKPHKPDVYDTTFAPTEENYYSDEIQRISDTKVESQETIRHVAEDKTYVRQTTYDVVKDDTLTENVDISKKQIVDKKKIFSIEEPLNKHKPVEKETSVHTGEISSKKAFFERKAQDLSTTTTKDNSTFRRESLKSKTNEKPVSQTTPDKKFVTNKDKQTLESITTDKINSATFIKDETDFFVSTNLNEMDNLRRRPSEKKPYEDDDVPRQKPITADDIQKRKSPEPKETVETDKLRQRPPEVSTPEKTIHVKPNRDSTVQKPGRQSPTRESPDRKVISAPHKQGPTRLSSESKGPETEPKRTVDRPSRISPERKDLKAPQKPSTDRPSRESPERRELRSPQKPISDRPIRDSPERKDARSPLKPTTYKPNRQSPESKEITSPSRPSIDRPTRQSPERKDTTRSPQKPTADKPSRQSPERKEVTSPLRPVTDRPSRQSPERKDVRSPKKPTSDKPSRQSPERKELRSSQKPSSDRLIRDSPERKDTKSPQKPVSDRLSRTSIEHGEIRVLQKTTDKPSRASPDRNEPVNLKKFSVDRGSRESPERKPSTEEEHTTAYEETSVIRRTSLKRDSPEKKEPVELNRAGKFGVTLRRTSSTGSACTQRRRSSQGDSTMEIEDIHELALLEQMMEKAVGYEQRRRIRSQIRIVKRDLDEKHSTTTKKSETSRTSATMSSAAPLSRSGTKSPTCSPTRDVKTTRKTTQDQITDTTKTSEHKQLVSTSGRPSSPTKPLQETQNKQPQNSRKTSDTTEILSQQKSVVTNGYHKAEHEHTTFSTVRTEKRVETTREISATDSITSSYGVGPTDENGLPLFGLKALRRSNTIKTITNEVEESKTFKPTEEEPEVCDARGRPLFGLKALQTGGDYETMPEQKTSQQLKELVEKHEKNARAPESQPRQKPRAKLRDSFILQQDDSHVTNALEEFNSEQRGLSLRSIIKKHENLAHTSGTTHHETDSSTTVVSTKSVMDSDGNVSVTRDVLQGEMSCKKDEEPVGKIVQTKYSYHSPKTEDNQKGSSKTSKVTTTTVIGPRRLSGPKISEAEDDDIHIRNVTVERKTSGPTVTEYYDDDEDSEIIKEKSSLVSSNKKRLSTDENRITTKSFHRHEETDEDDEPVQRRSSGNFVSLAVRKLSGSKATDTENDDDGTQLNVSTSKFSKSSHKQVLEKTESSVSKSSSVRRQIFKDEHDTSTSTEDKKKTLIRGDSVRALQHKFQQASAMKQPSVKQSGRDSPEKVSQTKSEQIIESVSTSKVTPSVEKSERSTVTTTSTTKKASSFLDNTSRVTGVQDILTRMKNADLVVESGDTNEDAEARALLNKFLGASVILQGMEQGMKSDNATTPGSAALVSRVEKQRIATTNRKQEEDIDNIWDEKQLHILLEACSDYEGRRKIRQRLRTVMAEHKACADVVADAGEDNSNSSVSQGECALMTPASLLHSQSSQSSGVDDSGTESGDDFRLLSPEILAEVQNALVKLESALPGIDPVRRESLVQLVNRLQHCLKLQTPNAAPQSSSKRFANKRLLRQKRHTVGVSKEELADARRWLLETGLDKTDNTDPEPHKIQKQKSASNIDDIEQDEIESEPVVSKLFCPVKFVPVSTNSSVSPYVPVNSVEVKYEHATNKINTEEVEPFMHRLSLDFTDEQSPLSDSLSYNNQHREIENGSSLLEYDPSLVLFTPAQSVQIAVHKAAINKQISQEESKRRGEESDDEGDVSSAEEEPTVIGNEKPEAVTAVHSTVSVVTDTAKKVTTPIRFHNRNSKKLKMKRANTIDIPKPLQFCDAEGSSCDEYDRASADELSKDHLENKMMYSNESKLPQPNFEPKTENDMKFLAFLKQAKENSSPKTINYNPSARGGLQWNNRFTNIKTAFEMPPPKKPVNIPKTKPFTSSSPQWQDNIKHEPPPFRQAALNRSPQPLQSKLPWKAKEENGVVIGSLTVSKTPIGPINQFSHATKSAFKPIDKNPIQKFQSVSSPTATNRQFGDNKYYETNMVKQYPPVHDKEFSVPQNKTLIQSVPKSLNKPITNYHNTSPPNYINNQQKEVSSNNSVSHAEYPYYKYTESPVSDQHLNSPLYNITNQYFDGCDNKEHNQQSYISFPYSIVENSCLRPSSEPDLEECTQIFSDQSQNYFSSDTEQYIKNEVPTNITHSTTPPEISSQTASLKIPLIGDKPLTKEHITQAKTDNVTPSNDHGYGLLTNNVQKLNSSIAKDSVQHVGSNNSTISNHSSINSSSSHKEYDTSPYQFDDSADSVSASPVLWVKRKEESSVSSPEEVLEEQTAITRVMGRPQCQQAVTICNRTQRRYDNDPAAAKKLESELRLRVSSKSALKTNAKSPTNISLHNSSNVFLAAPTNVSLKIPLNVSSGVTHSEKITKNISSNVSEKFPPKMHIDVPSNTVNVKKLASKMSSINSTGNNTSKNVVGHHGNSHSSTKHAVCHQSESVNTTSIKKHSNVKPPSILRSPPAITVSKSPLNSASPTFPNVLQKSESWHQMVKEQNVPNTRLVPPQSPRLSKTKSSHNLAFPKQFEAALSAEAVSEKQSTVDYYLNQNTKVKKKEHIVKTAEKKSSVSIIKLDDDLENVDEAFESLFVESSKKKK